MLLHVIHPLYCQNIKESYELETSVKIVLNPIILDARSRKKQVKK